MILDQLTSPEIEQLSRKTPCIIPLAATEQHGPHLPLATDRMIGWHFLLELEKQIAEKILVLPSLTIGCSEHHLDFAGTLHYSHDTHAAMVEDIIESLMHHGFGRIILFNSHGGNQGLAQTLVERLGPEVEIMVAITWWKLATSALRELNESGFGGVGHAGEFETSLMLHIAPELVKEDLISPGQNQPTVSWAKGDLLQAPSVSLYKSMQEMTPNGVLGDPTAATAEKGARITALVVSRLKEIIFDLNKM